MKEIALTGIMYRYADNVFYCEAAVTRGSATLVLDTTDFHDIKAFKLSDVASLGEADDFISRWHPDYNGVAIAQLDDLDCVMGCECDSEKLERVTSEWGSDPSRWAIERDLLYHEILVSAIKNYKRANGIK